MKAKHIILIIIPAVAIPAATMACAITLEPVEYILPNSAMEPLSPQTEELRQIQEPKVPRSRGTQETEQKATARYWIVYGANGSLWQAKANETGDYC